MDRISSLGIFLFSACYMSAAMTNAASIKTAAATEVCDMRPTESALRILNKRSVMTTINWRDVFDEAVIKNLLGVKYHIEQENFPLNQTNDEGETLAHIAAKGEHLVLLQYLLRRQLSLLEVKDNWDQTVFAIAIKKGDEHAVRYMVEDLNVDIYHPRHQCFGNMAIHIAAAAGQMDVLKYFVEERKVDVNLKNLLKEPPVFLAAEKPSLRAVRYLVEKRNATVTALGPHKENILFVSAKRGDLVVPKYLLDRRKIPFDINWQDVFGRTVVYIASRYNNLEFVKYCVEEKGANIHLTNNRGWTPLFEASSAGNPKIFEYLLEKGADIDHRDNANQTLEKVADAAITELLNRTRHERNRRCVPQNIKLDN